MRDPKAKLAHILVSSYFSYQVNLYDTAGKGDVKKGLGDLEEPVFAFGQGELG